jgi:CRP-like cAMP-binding protein
VVRRAYRADPDLADNLLRSLAALVRQATDERSLLVFHDLTARVARQLLDDTARHADGMAWVHGHPAARLAARAGGSEAAVRRILRVFERNGLIHSHGAGLVVVDRELLERLAASAA